MHRVAARTERDAQSDDQPHRGDRGADADADATGGAGGTGGTGGASGGGGAVAGPSVAPGETETPAAREECPECGGSVVGDEGRGERVCDDCGLVVATREIDRGPEWRTFDAGDREQKSRVGAPVTETMHDRGMSTVIGWQDRDAHGNPLSGRKREQIRRLRKWERRGTSSEDRRLRTGLGEVLKLASNLDCNDSVKEETCSLYRRAVDADLLPARSIESVAAACLYAVVRRRRLGRTIEDVGRASAVRQVRINRAYRQLVRELDLQVPPPSPRRFYAAASTGLGLPDDVRLAGRRLLEAFVETGAHAGKDPRAVAVGAAYSANRLLGDPAGVTQADAGEVGDTSAVTIRNRHREMMSDPEVVAAALRDAPEERPVRAAAIDPAAVAEVAERVDRVEWSRVGEAPDGAPGVVDAATAVEGALADLPDPAAVGGDGDGGDDGGTGGDTEPTGDTADAAGGDAAGAVVVVSPGNARNGRLPSPDPSGGTPDGTAAVGPGDGDESVPADAGADPDAVLAAADDLHRTVERAVARATDRGGDDRAGGAAGGGGDDGVDADADATGATDADDAAGGHDATDAGGDTTGVGGDTATDAGAPSTGAGAGDSAGSDPDGTTAASGEGRGVAELRYEEGDLVVEAGDLGDADDPLRAATRVELVVPDDGPAQTTVMRDVAALLAERAGLLDAVDLEYTPPRCERVLLTDDDSVSESVAWKEFADGCYIDTRDAMVVKRSKVEHLGEVCGVALDADRWAGPRR